MKKNYVCLILMLCGLFFFKPEARACHGVALVNYAFTVNANDLTINASSGAATCGCGPYWMQVELSCTANGLTGLPPVALQNQLTNWVGPGNTFLQHPWYFSLLNLPNYTQAAGWTDQCLVEPYVPITIPFANLCPGQTYFFRAREWVGGSSSPGPWTAMNQFTVPGAFVPLDFQISASPPVYCAPGSSTLTVSGITGGCGFTTISWTPGASTSSQVVVSPPPGTTVSYSATVRTPCETITKVINVTAISLMSAAFTPTTPTVCVGASTNFSHTGTPGSNINHVWDISPTTGVTIAAPNGSVTGVTFANTGTFVVTHTVSLGVCNDVKTTTVTVVPSPTAAVSFTNPTCAQPMGSASVTASGGTPGYTYSWTPGGGTSPNPTNNMPPGTYTAMVKDVSGCTYTTAITLVQVPGPTALALTVVNESCGQSNGSINTPTVTGGVATYSFSLNGGAFTTTPFTGLAASTKSVTVKDANGCTFTSTVAISNTPPPTGIALTSTPSSCSGPTGTYSIGLVTGGTAPYTYSVNPGAPGFTSNTSYTNQAGGTYTVTVKDVNNCSYSTTVVVVQPPSPTAMAVTAGSVTCIGGNGTATVTGVTGGAVPYQYNVNGGAYSPVTAFNSLAVGTNSCSVQDANGCVFTRTFSIGTIPSPTLSVTSTTNVSCNAGNNGAISLSVTAGVAPFSYTLTPGGANNTTGLFTGLTAQAYTLTVKDNVNCSSTTTAIITQPALLTIAPTAFATTCFGVANGSATAVAAGGTAAYQFNIDGSPFQAASSFTALAAGVHTLSVKDAQNCTATGTITVTQPNAMTLAMVTNSANCVAANGTATVTPGGGGVPPYTYTWTGTGGTNAITNGITAGNYTVTVRDANNCVSTASANIGVIAGGTASVTGIADAVCFGASNGSLTVQMAGNATPPFTYSWSPAGGNAINATNVPAGPYNVQVVDAYGCIANAAGFVSQPSALTITSGGNPFICYGTSGQISATAAGGSPAYSYTCMPGNFAGPGPHTVNPTTTSQYTYTASDSHGCVTAPLLINVTVSPQLTAQGYSIAACNGNSVTLTPTLTSVGNGGPYTYTWTSGGSNAGTLNPVASLSNNPATYTVAIEDGCTVPGTTATFTVIANPNPTPLFAADKLQGCEPLNVNFGAASINPGDTYTWTPGDNSTGNGNPYAHTYLNDGVYSVKLVVKNGFGCAKDTTLNNYITVHPLPLPSFDANPNPADIVNSTVTFNNTTFGGSTYIWDFGDYGSGTNNSSTLVNPMHDYHYAGTYMVHLTATSIHGCVADILKPMVVNPEFALYIPNAFTVDGNGLNDTFMPVGIGFVEDGYQMRIFDRWGVPMYNTNNIYQGWDGRDNGKAAKDGVYVYKITVKDLKGKEYTYVGNVTLLNARR